MRYIHLHQANINVNYNQGFSYMNTMTKHKKVTIYNIADQAEVSVATVSRVINNDMKVSFDTRKKILDLCRENNYSPKARKKKQSMNIGVVINKVTDPSALLSEYVSGIIQGALEVCQTMGNTTLSIIVLDASSLNPPEIIVQELISRDLQGAIFVNPRVNAEYVEKLHDVGYPFICVGSFFTNPKISSINIDNREGIRLAVEHLKSNGHSIINFVTIQSYDYDSIERQEAFQAYVSSDHCPDNMITIKTNSGDHKKAAFTYFDKKITSGKISLPSSFICLNDNVAIGLIHALKKHGIRVPEDISVVGYDNYTISQYYTPTLSCIDNPILQIGHLACSAIVDFINGNKAVFRRLIIPNFIKRESSGIAENKKTS